MYLLDVSYKTHPNAVEPHAQTHGAWIKKHIERGDFLIAGPKASGLGGVILARAMDKAQVLEIIQGDSYVQADVAEYSIIAFTSKIAAKEVAALIEQ
jgi:uncharacterized protein YciI